MPALSIECAKSGRSHCCISGELIPDRAWRIQFTIVPGFRCSTGFLCLNATKFAGAEAFLGSLAICKRARRSEVKVCTITERLIKVEELYVTFHNGRTDQAIHLSRAAPFLKEIMDACQLSLDLPELIKQSSLSQKDKQRASNELLGKQEPEKATVAFQENPKAPKPCTSMAMKLLGKPPNCRKGRSAVPAPRKPQKPTVVKKRIQKASRGARLPARAGSQPSIERESRTDFEQLLGELPDKLHDGVVKWGRENGMKSVDMRVEADMHKERLAAFLSGSARLLQKRLSGRRGTASSTSL